MARQFIASVRPSTAGVNPAPVAAQNAAAGGHSFNLGRNTILVAQTAGTVVVLTFLTPGAADSGNLPDKAVTLPATGTRMFQPGQAPGNIYAQDDGTCWIDPDVATGLTLWVIEP